MIKFTFFIVSKGVNKITVSLYIQLESIALTHSHHPQAWEEPGASFRKLLSLESSLTSLILVIIVFSMLKKIFGHKIFMKKGYPTPTISNTAVTLCLKYLPYIFYETCLVLHMAA